MRTGKLKRMLALVLVLVMCFSLAMPASAAPFKVKKGKPIKDLDTEIVETVIEDTQPEPTIKGFELVDGGDGQRATTYEVIYSDGVQDTGSTTLKYFPVTLYNYDDRINNDTHQMEVDAGLGTQWNGLYFGGNEHGANVTGNEAYEDRTVTGLESGVYYLRAYRSSSNNRYLCAAASGSKLTSNTNATKANTWNVTANANGTYYVSTYYNGAMRYLTVGNGTALLVPDPVELEILSFDNDGRVLIGQNGYYLNQYGGQYQTVFAGYSSKSDAGSAFYITLENGAAVKANYSTSVSRTSALPYAAWNKWVGVGDGDHKGNRVYSGLAENRLDAEKNIVLTKTNAGIFTSNTTNKDVYTHVGLPFVYDGTYYTFDANTTAAYFHTDSTQRTSATPASNSNLYFSATPQSHDFNGSDKRTKGWFPFNDAQSVTTAATGTADYFFGMNATIPFSMTANGQLVHSDGNVEDIKFEFSGDDDVWVFIDGVLVLDMGGNRNMLDGSINFATNTWEITVPYTVNNNGQKVYQNGGNLGDAATNTFGAINGKIFNADGVTGVLNTTRETFAAQDSHDLTIFYLERGAGSSNCRIRFNLPVKDYVSVKKIINQSKTLDSNGDYEVSPLTPSEQAAIDQMDFGFTLMKNGQPVRNTTYNLINANGQFVSSPATDANGHFTLKNGETARFVGVIASAPGNEYYVVEDAKEGFIGTEYTYSANAVSNTMTAAADGLTSMKVCAVGSDESEDSVNFVCTNYMDNKLANPGALVNDDKIVIDYGLPVEIDPMANDLFRGDSMVLNETITGARFGSAEVVNGKVVYTLNQQLTEVEVLTYSVTVTGTASNVGGGTNSDTVTMKGKIYIIPATTMYYEEDFGFVTFTNGKSSGWSDVGTAQTDFQEPGVVGTVGDSPYGSDVAYLNDGGDSNGSSKKVVTTAGAAQFSYSFTGTGTSFFARTSRTTGYMRVVITNSDGDTVYSLLRDTSYKNDGVLYNVPVFTYNAENYGTYTVTVTIAGGNSIVGKYGNEFYLDGIRVYNPLSGSDSYKDVALAAYAADGEANMTFATLREKLLVENVGFDDDGNLVWNEGMGFVLFTDTNGEIVLASEYQSNGPKEEVYMNNGQSVTFSLKDWDPNTNRLYIGIKAPMGAGSVKVNGNAIAINNAVDCYYEVSSMAVISEVSGHKIATFTISAESALISLTNLKVTGNAKFVIATGNDYEPPVPDPGDDDPGEDVIVDDEDEGGNAVVIEDETEIVGEIAEETVVIGEPEEIQAPEKSQENF